MARGLPRHASPSAPATMSLHMAIDANGASAPAWSHSVAVPFSLLEEVLHLRQPVGWHRMPRGDAGNSPSEWKARCFPSSHRRSISSDSGRCTLKNQGRAFSCSSSRWGSRSKKAARSSAISLPWTRCARMAHLPTVNTVPMAKLRDRNVYRSAHRAGATRSSLRARHQPIKLADLGRGPGEIPSPRLA